jgi:hypothetical protein
MTHFFKLSRTFDPQALRQLGTELKPRVTTPVEYMYNFETGQAPASIIYNTRRAQELLTDMTFIYAVCHPVVFNRVLIEEN